MIFFLWKDQEVLKNLRQILDRYQAKSSLLKGITDSGVNNGATYISKARLLSPSTEGLGFF